jgi:hypothetical protein
MALNIEGGLNVEGAAAIPQAPLGTVTIGTVVVGETTATIPFTYSDTDQTDFEYRVNSGTAISTTNPISLTGLVAGTAYTVEVRAVNATGSGAWSAVSNFTTDAVVVAPTVPQGIVTIGLVAVTETTATVTFTYDDTDQDSFEYQIDSGAITAGTTPISITSLTASTAYTVRARAINATGSGNWSVVSSFTTTSTVIIPTSLNFGIDIDQIEIEMLTPIYTIENLH